MKHNDLRNSLFNWIKTLLITTLSIASLSSYASNLPDSILQLPIKTTDGQIVRLIDFKGKQPVYLKFWATWCQPCMAQMPHFEKIQQQFGKNVKVIAINLAVNDELNDVLAVKKQFKLTMPIAMDVSGDLAQAMQLTGTPYHLLFDKQINLVHVGHDSGKQLTNKLELLTQAKPLTAIKELISTNTNQVEVNYQGQSKAILFGATWCDWYFADMRPSMSERCITLQNQISSIKNQYPNINIHGVMSRLWTDEKALANYTQRYKIDYPIEIDTDNRQFHQLGIKQLPTLVLIKNGVVVDKIVKFNDAKIITQKLLDL